MNARTCRAILLIGVFVVPWIGSLAGAQTPQPPSTCSGPGCYATRHADLFIATFAAGGNSKGLRAGQLEQQEDVRNAFWGIDATLRDIERGTISRAEGEFIIAGFESTIRWYIHNQSDDAVVIATFGQTSDIPALRRHLGGLLSVARQDALLGHEQLAQEAQGVMRKVLMLFSEAFANNCDQQTFDVVIPMELERQNQLMGTGISVMHCTRRKLAAEFSHEGVTYQFESCSAPMDGVSQHSDKWYLKLSGRVVGKGEGNGRHWLARFPYLGHDVEMGGFLDFVTREVEIENGSPNAVPHDAGPHARLNRWVSAPVPKPAAPPKKVVRTSLRSSALHFFPGGVTVLPGQAEAEIKHDEPCRSP